MHHSIYPFDDLDVIENEGLLIERHMSRFTDYYSTLSHAPKYNRFRPYCEMLVYTSP
jgi:hypothetical protein